MIRQMQIRQMQIRRTGAQGQTTYMPPQETDTGFGR